MSYLTELTLDDGIHKQVKDIEASHYLGTTSSNITEGAITSDYSINVSGIVYALNPTNSQKQLSNNDMVASHNGLFIANVIKDSTNTGSWKEIANISNNLVTEINIDNASTILTGSTVANISTTGSLSGGDAYNKTTNPIATKLYVDSTINNLPEPMVFTGSITITADSTDTSKCIITVSKPSSSSAIKKGFTYKITNISSSPKYTGTLVVGDTLIASKDSPNVSSAWVEDIDWTIVPSGDETGFVVGLPSGTTENNIVTWGADGYNIKNSGISIETTLSVNSDTAIPTSKAIATYATGLINSLDATGNSNISASKTIATWSETDGIISITLQDISISSAQVSSMSNYSKPLSTSAIETTDTLNQAIGKLETGLDDKQNTLSATNLLNPAYIDYNSTHKLSSDLVDDTNATNKFATVAQLNQIETNKTNILLLQQKMAKVYGFHVNPNESDSSAAVTYLMDAVGMTPAKMGSTAFDWGSWADAFFIPKPCMVKPDGTVDYYLNPNNYAQKLDGTASELATAPTDNLLSDISYTNNAMMEWGKIWFKYEAGQTDGEWSFYVSNMNVDGTFKCWCNINANNNEIDHFYTAIYNGVGCKSKMRSVSGVKLSTANEADTTTVAQEIASAVANNATTNPEWYTEVWSDRLLINALLYLMGKSLDLQGTFGNGISSGGQTKKQNYITGSLDDKGLFWGDISGTATAVKVFGMENLWACCWRRIAGCILDNNVLKVKMTYDTADGSSAHGYNLTGTGYLNFGSPASADGWLSKMTADSEMGYKPSATQSSSSLYYKDYFDKRANIVAYLLLGGSSGYAGYCGFYCGLGTVVSTAIWNASAALSLKRWG